MTSRLSRRIGILLVVVVTLFVGGRVFAQGGPLGATNTAWAQINAKLDQVLAALSPASPVPGPVVLTTGLLLTEDLVHCVATNVSSVPLTVTARMLNAGGRVEVETLSPLTIDPGRTGTLFFSGGELVRCEFSFVGHASDLRANAQTVDADTAKMEVVLEAR